MREAKSLQDAAANRERSEYLKSKGWKWIFIDPNPPSKPKVAKRKLFANNVNQLLRPTITVYRR